MRKRASEALIEMGMPASINGFQYIVDAMCLFNDKYYRFGNITNLYEKIGEINGTDEAAVERCIRYAFSYMLLKGNREAMERIMLYKSGQAATNKNLLHLLFLNLSLIEKEENECANLSQE